MRHGDRTKSTSEKWDTCVNKVKYQKMLLPDFFRLSEKIADDIAAIDVGPVRQRYGEFMVLEPVGLDVLLTTTCKATKRTVLTPGGGQASYEAYARSLGYDGDATDLRRQADRAAELARARAQPVHSHVRGSLAIQTQQRRSPAANMTTVRIRPTLPILLAIWNALSPMRRAGQPGQRPSRRLTARGKMFAWFEQAKTEDDDRNRCRRHNDRLRRA